MLTCERQGGYYSSHQLTQGNNRMREAIHNITLLSVVICPLFAVFGSKLYAPIFGEFAVLTFAYLLLVHPITAWVLFKLLKNQEI